MASKPSYVTDMKRLAREFARYFGASLAAFLVDFAVLIAATEVFGLHYLASASLGFCAGIAVIYLLSVRWVFKHRRLADARAEVAWFLMTGVIGLGLNAVVMFAVTDMAGAPYVAAKIAAAGFVFTFNYLARKTLLFRATETPSEGVGHV